MLRRVLVANRGEIAKRIILAASQLGIETVQVYSTEDRDSLPVSLATKAVYIGPPEVQKSYLNQDVIIQTAISCGCDAIHPGYGFLSENPDFALNCENNGIKFIGPSSKVIQQMGNKQMARSLMEANGVPVVPGSKDIVKTPEEAKEIANKIGYPILLKAVAGGGGRGMRVAYHAQEVLKVFNAAETEAYSAFGNGDIYVEKLIQNPRHIEVQIIADEYGNIIHLGERDCSIQRRNQKIIEEAPAYILSDVQREKISEDALKAVKAAGYNNAGTAEFLIDQFGNHYFIEMNTRLQVEHSVTEMITGIDIVREQLLVAGGKKLSIQQEKVNINGAAIECRVNAENIEKGFAPSPGVISSLRIPSGNGIRVETALRKGDRVSPWYDSMICKLISYAPNRPEAIRKMKFALKELNIEGIATNIAFLKKIINDYDYIQGNFDTNYVHKILAS